MPFLNVDDDFTEHPKIVVLSDAAFRLQIAGMCATATARRIDLPVATVGAIMRKHGIPLRCLNELLEAELWADRGAAFEVVQGRWPDYPVWQARTELRHRVKIPPEVRELVYSRDGHACVVCGATEDLTLDHIYPWSLGGADEPDNLQTLCRPCNARKGARLDALVQSR